MYFFCHKVSTSVFHLVYNMLRIASLFLSSCLNWSFFLFPDKPVSNISQLFIRSYLHNLGAAHWWLYCLLSYLLSIWKKTDVLYHLDLRQAPFRLFNNYLIPISSVEEATDALRAVAESINVLLQSVGPSLVLFVSLFKFLLLCLTINYFTINMFCTGSLITQ